MAISTGKFMEKTKNTVMLIRFSRVHIKSITYLMVNAERAFAGMILTYCSIEFKWVIL